MCGHIQLTYACGHHSLELERCDGVCDYRLGGAPDYYEHEQDSSCCSQRCCQAAIQNAQRQRQNFMAQVLQYAQGMGMPPDQAQISAVQERFQEVVSRHQGCRR